MSNLNERAKQLARYGEGIVALSRRANGPWVRYEDVDTAIADSANLARGLAIAQAAQHVCRMDNEFAILGCSCGWVAERYDAELWKAHIRSLDPDAAQALAHHNATVFHDTLDDLAHDGSELVVGGKEPVRIFSEAELERRDAELKRKWLVETANRQAAHEAEIERRARLDEHKKDCSVCRNPISIANGSPCERAAALAESQPAPDTPPKDSPMTLLVNALNDPRWAEESTAMAREIAQRAREDVEVYLATPQGPAPAKEGEK